MSLEVGYDVFNDRLFPIKLDEDENTWVCGRCEVTYAWYDKVFSGNYDSETNLYNVIVFNPEFDGHYMKDLNSPSLCAHMHYRPFRDFKKKVEKAINIAIKNHNKLVANLRDSISETHAKIEEYRNLQIKSVTSAAFDGYQRLIENAASNLVEEQSRLKNIDSDDYDFAHAKLVQQMLNNIEEHLSKGEIVTAYYSD